MDTKEYIESGILEAYLLGSLTPDEERVVTDNIASYPELARELDALEITMQQYSAKLAKTPPPGLEDKIWNVIQAASANPANKPAAKVIEFPAPQARTQWRYAAVWIALIGSVIVNMVLWQQGNQRKDENNVISYKLTKLESDQKELAQLNERYVKERSMMADTGMQTIIMHTMQKGHPMAATLYWSKDKGEAYVTVDALPVPPKGMQYQLWVMQGGKPVSMGVLPNSMANTPEMQKIGMSVTSGEAFAISLEKEGGSPAPTMENIYVMGKA